MENAEKEKIEKENVEKRKRKLPYKDIFFFFFRRFPFRRFSPNPIDTSAILLIKIQVFLH